MKRDAVKTLLDSVLHLLECLRSGGNTVSSLGRAPVLLNEVKFAMIFRIEITQMTVPLDELLDLQTLIYKVGLNEKCVLAATVDTVWWALELWALS